jgi:UV excision repair protein RAD23
VKGVINSKNTEFTIEKQKLIHAGKVLKDEQTLAETGVKEGNFLVVMISKPKRTAAPTVPHPNAAAEPEPAAASAPAASTAPASSTVGSTEAATLTPVGTSAAPVPAPPPAVSTADLQALQDMGFPGAECRAALEAAARIGGGRPLAVEFLMNGIPPNFPSEGTPSPATGAPGGPPPSSSAPSPVGASSGGLEQLRNHPQFNMLRQLVQSNPQALSQVMAQIGAQSPQLLEAIRANPAEFMQMLNEPVAMAPTPVASAPGEATQGAGAGVPGNMVQIAQMLANMPESQRNQMAQQMGMSSEQLAMAVQAMGQMNPAQLQGLMGMMGAGGLPGGLGQGPAQGANVIRKFS